MLITHGCALDKANSRGRPTIKRLHFLPLAAVDVQDPTRQVVLRRDDLTPYEVIYLGNCGHLGEVFATLSEMYYLPSGYFQIQLEEFGGHPEAQQGERYLIATNDDSRVGRLEVEQVERLKDKISAYWSRRLPVDVPPTQPQGIMSRAGGYVDLAVTRIANILQRK